MIVSGDRILVVDDNIDLRTGIVEGLLSAGYRVECAADGQEAVSVIERNMLSLPDLIICNLAMPRMDGLQFLTWMWGQRALPKIPTLIVTGTGHSLTALEAGEFIIGSLIKPFALTTLLDIIARHVVPAAENANG
ncbi:MAG: response regulator [Candidatus Sericytochromatia bacterium]|nr:response regulator [Candidatus Sericytochromatia bacterium]